MIISSRLTHVFVHSFIFTDRRIEEREKNKNQNKNQNKRHTNERTRNKSKTVNCKQITIIQINHVWCMVHIQIAFTFVLKTKTKMREKQSKSSCAVKNEEVPTETKLVLKEHKNKTQTKSIRFFHCACHKMQIRISETFQHFISAPQLSVVQYLWWPINNYYGYYCSLLILISFD